MKVLMLDDDKRSQMVVCDMLAAISGEGKGENYKVETHSLYDSALDAALSQPYDVFLVDYHLQDAQKRDGLDFVYKLQQQGSLTPSILLTSHGSRDLDLRAMRVGVADYLDKTMLNPQLLDRSLRYAVERARHINDLRLLYQQVSELEQLKTEMIRMASHDFGNRVTNLMMTGGLLARSLEGRLNEREQKYISQMENTMQEMRRLTTDILSLERIETTLYQSNLEQIDLKILIAQIHAEYVVKARQIDRHLHCNLPDEPVMVRGNSTQLYEAIINLVENALKYTPENGHIRIRLWLEDEHACFEISDTGYGIPEKQLSHLFQPFYRAKSPETSGIAGTGLGLYIVKNIMTRHEGDVWVKSVYGEGSAFGFYLPQDTGRTKSA